MLSSWRRRRFPVTALMSGALIVGMASNIEAQAAGAAAHAQAPNQDQQLARQLEELRAQIARLQAAIDQQRQSAPAPSTSAPTQPSAGMDKMEMGRTRQGGMAEMEKQKMETMPQGGMGMMDMHKGEMGMAPEGMKMPGCCMMPEMGRMNTTPTGSGNATGRAGGAMVMPGSTTGTGSAGTQRSMSSLPGVPGASHLYHIGSTGFFLDQPMIMLSSDQQNALNKVKERALLERSNAERRIEQAEQELWTLTGADQPDSAKIQTKAREIEQIRTNQRFGFIQAVGEATKILSAEQRNHLLGMATMPTK
jgi:Spy/CpxP family protein refolding chaperone